MSVALDETFRLIDLSNVPVPDFVEALDYEKLRKSSIDFLVSLDPKYTALLESDPIIKLIEAYSYREMVLRAHINDVALANTITKAMGNDLEVIGAFFGVSRLEGEDIERYRSRVQRGIYTGAVAGPAKFYEYHALSAHVDIIDVGVFSPAPGEVALTVLAFEDVFLEDATEEEADIGAALFAQPVGTDKVRILARDSSAPLKAVSDAMVSRKPLTDVVLVQPPSVKTFTVKAKLVIYPGPDSSTIRQSALAALSVYLQRIRKVGYDATVSGILAALSVGGVQNVILESPLADIVALQYDLAVCLGAEVVVQRVDV